VAPRYFNRLSVTDFRLQFHGAVRSVRSDSIFGYNKERRLSEERREENPTTRPAGLPYELFEKTYSVTCNKYPTLPQPQLIFVRPAHFGYRFLSALPPADHERTNRPTRNLFIEQRPPTPTGELHHRVLRVTASPSAGSNLSRSRPDHRVRRFNTSPSTHHPPLEKRTTGCFA